MIAWGLVAAYLLVSLGFGFYALNCDFLYCETLGVLPATPWLQLSMKLGLDVPTILIGGFYLINTIIVYYLGHLIQHLRRN